MLPPRPSCLSLALLTFLLPACAGKPEPAVIAAPDTARVAPVPVPVQVVRETVTVRDPELDQKLARQEVALIEKDAQIEELQGRLDEARQEAVRAMAKLRTLATRAEAASAIAEAEIAVQALRASGGQSVGSLTAQAGRLLEQARTELNRENYGGALYLANQAKQIASTGRGRVTSAGREGLLPGEELFAVPLRLQALRRANVRVGPGTDRAVAYSLESGDAVIGIAHLGDWIRITDAGGRPGWVFRPLVGRRQ